MTARRFAVIGDPVAHSASPRMHAAAYDALGLPHRYDALRVPEGELARVITQLRLGELDGLNVTIPHKRAVLALADRIAPSARAVGAANTLVRDEGGLVVAHNTDAAALTKELAVVLGGGTVKGTRARRALVLGSGGAARAAIVALASLGVAPAPTEIVVRARAWNDAALAAELRGLVANASGVTLRFEAWVAVPATEDATDVVLQATSAGMPGGAPGGVAADTVAWEHVRQSAVAIDVVYAPAETPFVTAARRRGLRAVADGRGMLARQGALAFELWLGPPAPFDVMRRAL